MQYKAPQSGLNGRFGAWLSRKIKAVVTVVAAVVEVAVPIAGVFLADQIREFGNAFAESGTILNLRQAAPTLLEPTPAEQRILDAWLVKYQTWISDLANELGTAASKSTNAAKVAALNVVLNKINTVLDHYEINETTGLSKNAIETRISLIYETLKPINDAVEQLVSSLGTVSTVSKTFNPASYSFQPLFASTTLVSVTGDNYVLASNTLPVNTVGGTKLGTSTGVVKTPVKTTPVVNTPSTIPTTPVVSAPSAPVIGKVGDTPATVPSTTVGTTPATVVVSKKSSTGKTIAVLAVGVALAYAVFSGPSKPAKGTKAPARKTAAKRRSTTKKSK